MGGEIDSFGSGKFIEYSLLVNNEKLEDKLNSDKINWHNAAYKSKKNEEKRVVNLKKGLNRIAFECEAPYVPDIEFVRLSKSKEKTEISELEFNKFVEKIKKEKQDRINKPVSLKDTSDNNNKSKILDNPSGNYYHLMEVDFDYTTYKTFTFNTGESVSFNTHASDRFEHVIELFSSSNAEAYTWSEKSNSNGMASINVTIPMGGTYIMRIRSFVNETLGQVDLNVNWQYFYSDCVVAGSGLRYPHDTPMEYNYFTCYLTGDSRIWIEDDGLPGKIRAYNDDYNSGDGDYYWWYASRVKKDFNVRIGAVLVSSYGSYTPTGKCDLYMMCKNSSVYGGSFPELEANDAIQSAPSTGNGPLSQGDNYNCISWSGGNTDLGRYFWPPSGYDSEYNLNDWYDPRGDLQSFDNYYGNVNRYGNPTARWAGAPTYTRIGASASNAEIALWKDYWSDYQHGSVTKPGNEQPHGYDWESKIGGNERIFHPKNALANPYFYGNISDYYKRLSGLKSVSISNEGITLEESLKRGLTKLDEVSFSLMEKQQVDNITGKINSANKNVFDNLFNALIEKCNTGEMLLRSNPKYVRESSEYVNIVEFFNRQGKAYWPLLYKAIEEGNELALMILEYISAGEYGLVMEEVKKENAKNRYTKEGIYIAPSWKANGKKYVKKLLEMTDNNGQLKSYQSITGFENNISINEFSFFPNPVNDILTISFSLPFNSNIGIEVYDISGKKLVIEKQTIEYLAGNYAIPVNIESLSNGLYVCKIHCNNQIFNYKISKK